MENLENFKQFGKLSKSLALTPTTRNAVIYTRVSSKEQADTNMSLPTQKKYCYELAAKGKFNVIKEFGGTYESAKTDDRKEFERMLAFVRKSKSKQKVNYIIVYNLNRFSRTGGGAIALAEDLRKEGINVISCMQPGETNTPTGQLQMNIQLLFSKYENDTRTELCVNGMIERLLRGEWCGGAPVGYDNITINGKKTVRKNAMGEIIRQMFHWKVFDRLTHTQIVEKANALGMNTNLKRLTSIFRNPFYCGLMAHGVLNGEIVRGNHEPLVTQEVFLKANDVELNRPQGYSAHIENNNLPMKGFIRCSECGISMTGYTNHKKKLHYYKCNTRGCSNNVNVNQCHAQFQKLISTFMVKSPLLLQLKQQLAYTFEFMNKENLEHETQIKRRAADIQKKIDKVNERYAVGEIDRNVYDQVKSKFESELTDINKELGKVDINLSNLSQYIEFGVSISQNINILWQNSDYEMRQKIQYLAFPEGISYDKKNDHYLTPRINSFFAVLPVLSTVYGASANGKGGTNAPLSPLVASTGIEPVSKV